MSKLQTLYREDRELFDRYERMKGYFSDEWRKSEFTALMEWVEESTEYLVCPASSRFHLSEPRGLLRHSCNVAENALRIGGLLGSDVSGGFSESSLVLCGLLHDLGKAGHPGIPKYLVNEPTPRQKQYGYPASQPYRYNPDQGVVLTVPQQALYYITRMMPLSLEEYQAILIHDGQYVPENSPYAAKEEPLALVLHYADSWSGFVVEK